MMRENIGPTFCCFTMDVDDTVNLKNDIKSMSTEKFGRIKSVYLRETVEPGF